MYKINEDEKGNFFLYKDGNLKCMCYTRKEAVEIKQALEYQDLLRRQAAERAKFYEENPY